MANLQAKGRSIVHADGHFPEPPDLWERYLEAKCKPRAIPITKALAWPSWGQVGVAP